MQTAAVESSGVYGVVYLGVWTGRQTLVWQCRSVSWAARCRPVTHTLFQPAAWPGPSCPPRPSGPPNHPPSAGHWESTDRSNPTTRHAPCSAHRQQHHKPDPRAASRTKTNSSCKEGEQNTFLMFATDSEWQHYHYCFHSPFALITIQEQRLRF